MLQVTTFFTIFLTLLVEQTSPPIQNGKHVTELYELGMQAKMQHDYDLAQNYYQQAIRKDPDWGLVHLELAEVMRITGVDSAQRSHLLLPLHHALEKNPRYFYELAMVAYEQQNNEQALELIAKALQLRLSYWQVHLLKARILFKMRNYQQALTSFEKTIEFQSSNTSALIGLADCAAQLQDTHKEFLAIHRLVEISPQNPILLVRLGKLFEKRGDGKEAQRLYQKAHMLSGKQQKPAMRPLLPSKK